MNPTLILLRHGETEYTSWHRVTGTYDLPLSERGRAEFEKVVPKVRQHEIAQLYSSPMSRARETATMVDPSYIGVQHAKPIPAAVLDGLKPWDDGTLRGHFMNRDLRTAMSWLQEHPQVAAPGGESFGQFTNRFLGTLRNLLKRAGACRDIGCIVAVTHGQNLDTAMAWHKAGMRGTRIGTVEHGHNNSPGRGLIFEHAGGRNNVRGSWAVKPL